MVLIGFNNENDPRPGDTLAPGYMFKVLGSAPSCPHSPPNRVGWPRFCQHVSASKSRPPNCKGGGRGGRGTLASYTTVPYRREDLSTGKPRNQNVIDEVLRGLPVDRPQRRYEAHRRNAYLDSVQKTEVKWAFANMHPVSAPTGPQDPSQGVRIKNDAGRIENQHLLLGI